MRAWPSWPLCSSDPLITRLWIKTGLSGRYDFDLEFLPDDTQFNGALRDVIKPEVAYRYDLFAALQQQLGMKLEAKKGPVEALVIDRARRPSEN